MQDQKIFLDELIAFYKPVGPLETLQLERIASCRAKLNAIRELEQSKLLLLYSEHKSNIKKYIAGFTYLDPLVRGMIYELITFEKLILPCDLDTDNLEKIVDEIEAFSGVISSDSDFEEYVPCLTSYLLSINESEVNLNEKLLAVSKKLDFIIRNGDLYCEYLKKLIPDRFVDKKKEQTIEQLEFDRMLDEYQEQARIRRGEKFKINIKVSEPEFPDMKQINEAFEKFNAIWLAYQSTFENYLRVQLTIELHKRAISLPLEEIDLMMRYQTSWERRLSTLVGEFMHMQKIRLMNESSQAILNTNQSS